MEKTKLAIVVAFGLTGGIAFATGDFGEEPAPSLPFYLHRLPAKSMREIFDETAPASKQPQESPNFKDELLKIAKAAAHTKPAEVLPRAKKLIEAGRTLREPGSLLNVLLDVRDVLRAPGATGAEIAEYITWRVDNVDLFGFRWDEAKKPQDEPDSSGQEAAASVDAIGHDDASPAMKPFWTYLRGACAFKRHDDTKSQEWFETVLRDFPKSPKAEAALFMDGRCQISRSRSPDYTESEVVLVQSERPEAKELLEKYLSKYPEGDYAGDALGWLGAYYFDGKEYGKALTYYIRQTEVPGHPELAGPALIMCERVLSYIASAPSDLAFVEVARHPRAAMGLIYLILNTTEADNFDGKFDEVEQVKGWKKKILPRMAAAVAAQEAAYKDPLWRPRYLAILAYAASGAGQQEQALKLTNLPTAQLEGSDDLLFARGVALQRARRFPEAFAVFQRLLREFPDSPLARGAQLRAALALLDNKQFGAALVQFDQMCDKASKTEGQADAEDESAENLEPLYERDHPQKDDAEQAQIAQLIDAVLNFAPLPELATAAEDKGIGSVRALQIRQTLAARHLAHEEFAEAKRYVTPAQWGLAAAGIEKLAAEAAAAQPAERGNACLKLANAWATARGKLMTVPLDTAEYREQIDKGEPANANVRRIENAAALGLTGNLNLELENRDELRHAFNWWLEAADAAPKSPVAASGLWRALSAMPKMADVSIFTLQRARAKNYGAVSRRLYDRLRSECAHSVEAKRYAVYWNFPPPPAPEEGEEALALRRDRQGDVLRGSAILETKGTEDDWGGERPWEPVIRSAFELVANAGEKDRAGLLKDVKTLRSEARTRVSSLAEAFWLNFFDDLDCFLQGDDPGPEVRRRYIALRFECLKQSSFGYWPTLHLQGEGDGNADAALRKQIAEALADPVMKPVVDFLEFLDAAVVANHVTDVPVPGVEKDGEPFTVRSRDYPLLEKMMADFLVRYPKSRKREAALLLHARALFQLSNPRGFNKPIEWPLAGRWEGGYEPVTSQFEPFDPKRILAALDAYDRTFPSGKYAAEIRNYRAAVALRTRDLAAALRLTLPQIEDQTKPELQVEAADRLAKIFDCLADDQQRADSLADIKTDEKARDWLEKYLTAASGTHPLAYLRRYLLDQIGKPL